MALLITCFLIIMITYNGYWREWKTYHTTILYIVICNVFQNMVTGDYILWKFHPYPLPSHEHADIFMSIVSLPLLTLLYLAVFFKSNLIQHRVKIFMIWTISSVGIQYFLYKIKYVSYHHGYKFWMEPLFYLAMYSFLPLHHRRPLLTYLLTVLVVLFFITYFNVPIGS